MFTVERGKFYAGSLIGSAAYWSFGDGTLVTAPITDAGVVFEGSSGGTV
jgi:hypothetical protein